MLKFTGKAPKGKEKANTKYLISLNNETIELNLKYPSSLTNKFHIITDFVESVNKILGDKFADWFFNFLEKYQKEQDENFLIENIEILKNYIDEYFDKKNTDYSMFVDRTKVKKGTIVFEPDEIKKIIVASGYLKLYSFIFNSRDVTLPDSTHKKIYNIIVKDIMDTAIISKIFNVIRLKVFNYNVTDQYMWEYFEITQGKSIDLYVTEIFNRIMNSTFILCEEDKNPITYFIGVVEGSIKWFFKSNYKQKVVYEDSIERQNIHGFYHDNLGNYSYNDTLGRLKGIAYKHIYKKIDQTTPSNVGNEDVDEALSEFQERVLNIKYVSPLSKCLVSPILSKITNIPYFHFKKLSKEHSMVLSIYLQKLLLKVFKNEYSDLFSLLNCYPMELPSIATTYKIKQIYNPGGFISRQEKVKDFFGFDHKETPYNLISHFIGITVTVKWCNIFSGKTPTKIPELKLEDDMIKFYTLFFSSQFDDKIEELSKLVDLDFVKKAIK